MCTAELSTAFSFQYKKGTLSIRKITKVYLHFVSKYLKELPICQYVDKLKDKNIIGKIPKFVKKISSQSNLVKSSYRRQVDAHFRFRFYVTLRGLIKRKYFIQSNSSIFPLKSFSTAGQLCDYCSALLNDPRL